MAELSDFQQDVASLEGIEFRGLVTWPRKLLADDDRRGPIFGKAPLASTIKLLKHELKQAGAENARVQMALPDAQVRQDGLPRASARPEHPGVILSFDKPGVGRLVYPCDTFRDWHANLRAIAHTLKALRTPNSYGVLLAGEQYAGSRLLTAGGTATTLTAQAAADYLAVHAGGSPRELLRKRHLVEEYYRKAAQTLHPDRGGSAAAMDLATKARETLRAHHGLGAA